MGIVLSLMSTFLDFQHLNVSINLLNISADFQYQAALDKASSSPTLLSFLCHDILGVIVGFVEDSRSLAALSKTCQGFNIAINSTRLNLWQVHFEREVGMGGGRKEERLIGAGLSWKEKCRRGLELR